MQAFPIKGIAARGAAPDMAPYDAPQEFAHTCHNMRFYRGSLASAAQNIKLEFTWGPGGTADLDTIQAATIFNGRIWVVRGATLGNLGIYVLEDGTATYIGDHPRSVTLKFVHVNNSLLLVGREAPIPMIVCTIEPDGSEDRGIVPMTTSFESYPESDSWTRWVMTVFKNFFIAANLRYSGTRKANTLIWSDLIPYQLSDTSGPSWDVDDARTLAGEVILNPSMGDIRSLSAMGKRLVAYSGSASWVIDFVGGSFIFNNDDLFKNEGILNAEAVVELPNARHAVMSGSGLYIHDGVSKQRPADGRIKRFILDQGEGLRWAMLGWISSSQEIIIVTNNTEDGVAYSYNMTHDAWTTLDTDALAPGSEEITTLDTCDVNNFQDDWTTYNADAEPLNGYKGEVLLIGSDNGLYVDGYSASAPFMSRQSAPFELWLPYMDLSHITGVPDAYRYHWLHEFRMQGRMYNINPLELNPEDDPIYWQAMMYDRLPDSPGMTPPDSPKGAENIVSGLLDFDQEQVFKIDAPGRYTSLKIYRPSTGDSIFNLSNMTAEITPNAYRY